MNDGDILPEEGWRWKKRTVETRWLLASVGWHGYLGVCREVRTDQVTVLCDFLFCGFRGSVADRDIGPTSFDS